MGTWTHIGNWRGTPGARGLKGDRGPQGLPGVASLPADAAVAGYIGTEGESASKTAVLERIAEATSIVNVIDFGAVGDGEADDTAAIRAAITAVTDGGTVVFPAGFTFRLTGEIGNLDHDDVRKSVQFLAYGATFVKDGAFRSVNLFGDMENQFTVSTITSVLLEDPSGTVQGLTLTVSGETGWRRGDIVKMVADDIIPGTRDSGDPVNLAQARSGEWFTVYSTSGTEVVLAGTLIDSFTTNVRIARVKPYQVSWRGGKFEVSDAHIAAGGANWTFDVRSLNSPVISDVEIMQSTSGGVNVANCYKPHVANIRVGWGRNDSSLNALGYGVVNAASWMMTVDNCHFSQVRHGYTDGHAFTLPGGASFTGHGRPYGTSVSNCSVDSPTGSAYDTHTSSMHTRFTNCLAVNAMNGFGIRGRQCTVFDAIVRDVGVAVRIFDEGTGGKSWGHTIDGVKAENVSIAVVEISVNERPEAPDYNTREPRRGTIRNIFATGVNGRVFNIYNSCWIIENVTAEVTAQITTIGSLIDNAEVFGSNITLFYGAAPTSAVHDVFVLDPASNSRFYLDGLRVYGNAGKTRNLIRNPSTAVLRVTDVILDSPLQGVANQSLTVGGWVDWAIASAGGASSGAQAFTSNPNSQALSDVIARSMGDVILVHMQFNGGGTLQPLAAAARQGVQLVIVNDGDSNITITHNPGTHRIRTTGATNKALTPGASIVFIFDANGVWRQISPIG